MQLSNASSASGTAATASRFAFASASTCAVIVAIAAGPPAPDGQSNGGRSSAVAAAAARGGGGTGAAHSSQLPAADTRKSPPCDSRSTQHGQEGPSAERACLEDIWKRETRKQPKFSAFLESGLPTT